MAETEIFDASKGWGSEDFKLNHPFKFAGVEFRQFSFRVPTGADIDAYLNSTDRGLRTFATKIVDTDPKVLDAMHGGDYARLLKTVGEFVAGVR